jgi:pyocin large subunit-like protein
LKKRKKTKPMYQNLRGFTAKHIISKNERMLGGGKNQQICWSKVQTFSHARGVNPRDIIIACNHR